MTTNIQLPPVFVIATFVRPTFAFASRKERAGAGFACFPQGVSTVRADLRRIVPIQHHDSGDVSSYMADIFCAAAGVINLKPAVADTNRRGSSPDAIVFPGGRTALQRPMPTPMH